MQKNIAIDIVIVIVIVVVANGLVPASCNYWRWGSGGRQENINAICILALNHINDKVSSRLHHHRISFYNHYSV